MFVIAMFSVCYDHYHVTIFLDINENFILLERLFKKKDYFYFII